ncbi:MAG: hypothetical protein ACLQUY_04235 [Ktedonobacterales bacterium]
MNLVILAIAWQVAIVTTLASIALCYYIWRWDRQRTHVVLQYELDPAESASYQQLCSGLQALASTARLLRVDARQVHGDWKRNAGATTALHMSPAAVYPPGSLPWLETNVPVWSLRWRGGHLALIFLPDRLLIEQNRYTAALPYAQAQVTTAINNFIENGVVPPDARVVAYSWQFVNKDGGPDLRYKGNHQLPVTEQAYIGFQSPTGLNLMLQASNRQKTAAFVQSFQSFHPLICAEPPVLPA